MGQVIGFIGLGHMGESMASRLIKGGYALRVWNRSVDRAAPLVAGGAVLAAHAAEVAEPGGWLFSSLSDDHVLQEVIGDNHELLRRLSPGGIHVSTSTVSPLTSRRLAEQHANFGVQFVTAAVLGRPDAAAAGKLWVLVSGHQQAKQSVLPPLKLLGQRIFDFGDDPGAASVAKLASNFMLASAIEAMGETFAFAEKNGIARGQMAELLTQTTFDCPAYHTYAGLIAEQHYEPALFKMTLGMKDIGLALQTAGLSNVPMPLASLVHDQMLRAVANGRGNLDWAGLAGEASEAAGLRLART